MPGVELLPERHRQTTRVAMQVWISWLKRSQRSLPVLRQICHMEDRNTICKSSVAYVFCGGWRGRPRPMERSRFGLDNAATLRASSATASAWRVVPVLARMLFRCQRTVPRPIWWRRAISGAFPASRSTAIAASAAVRPNSQQHHEQRRVKCIDGADGSDTHDRPHQTRTTVILSAPLGRPARSCASRLAHSTVSTILP